MSDNPSSGWPELESLGLVDVDDGALWRAVLRTAADPIILIDQRGAILRANEATVELFGYSHADMVGQNVSMLMPEPDRSRHDKYMSNYLETGETRIIGIGREVEAMKADGTIFPIALAVSEIKATEGSLFTGVIHDLTARHAAERRLREANERLEQRVDERTHELQLSLKELSRSNRDLERFAYVASHDLQAPLRNVRQGLELLNEHLWETTGRCFDGEAEELRGHIVGAVERMEKLIEGLLRYSRVDRGDYSAVDLNAVVAYVTSQLQHDISETNATIRSERLPTVLGNETQLRQLLQNLIHNAIKYRSQDRPPDVVIDVEEEDGEWLVSISDNGVGVDVEQHSRIFELFSSVGPSRGGVGLGLAICQRIVERHDGRIWINSEGDGGARFSFTLPLGGPEGSSAPPPSSLS